MASDLGDVREPSNEMRRVAQMVAAQLTRAAIFLVVTIRKQGPERGADI
jgi:hypothetical protein